MVPPAEACCEPPRTPFGRSSQNSTDVKIAPAAAHFHGFGVARQGPWVTWVNKAASVSVYTDGHLFGARPRKMRSVGTTPEPRSYSGGPLRDPHTTATTIPK